MVIMLLSLSSCAARKAIVQQSEVGDRWVIVPGDTPGEHYVFVKDPHDLEKTLDHMGCKQHPCAVGRLGDLYVISEPVRKDTKN